MEVSMGFDYTKTVLTIIAVAVSVLAIENAIPKKPRYFTQDVRICDSSHCLELAGSSRGGFYNFALPISSVDK
jgi:hypothetical protein